MVGTCSTRPTMKSKDQTRSRGDARTPVADEEEPRRISITFTHSTLCQTIRFIEHVRSAINRALFDISIRYDWFDSNNYFSTVKHTDSEWQDCIAAASIFVTINHDKCKWHPSSKTD